MQQQIEELDTAEKWATKTSDVVSWCCSAAGGDQLIENNQFLL